jgi:hypothetical protein
MLINQLSYQSNCSQTNKLFHISIDNQEADSLRKQVTFPDNEVVAFAFG